MEAPRHPAEAASLELKSEEDRETALTEIVLEEIRCKGKQGNGVVTGRKDSVKS